MSKKKKKQKELQEVSRKKPEKKKKQKKNEEAFARQIVSSEVYDSFSRLIRLINKISNEPVMFQGNSYHSAEIRALEEIKKTQPVSTADLANQLKVTRSAVLKTTNKLVHKGLIRKQKSSENGRIIEIALTEPGEEFIAENTHMSSPEEEPIKNALEKMSDTELAYFNDAILRILINLV